MDAVIAEVRDEDDAVRGYGYAGRVIKLAVARTLGPPLAEERTRGGEILNSSIINVGYVDGAGGRDVDAIGAVELAVARS